jgi:hypothetical protein
MDFTDLAYGTNEHRREPRPARKETGEHESMGDDMMDIGKMAVGGMITVGVIGALGSAFHKS